MALTLTLHLDPTVTLVPGPRRIDQTTLVRQDIPVDELLAIAARHRPDLRAVRALLRAAEADTGQTVWGGLGPGLQAGYSVGGIKTYVPGKDYRPLRPAAGKCRRQRRPGLVHLRPGEDRRGQRATGRR